MSFRDGEEPSKHTSFALCRAIEERMELLMLEYDADKRPRTDLELIRLNDALERLRIRLVRWASSGATSTSSMTGQRGYDPRLHINSSYWRF